MKVDIYANSAIKRSNSARIAERTCPQIHQDDIIYFDDNNMSMKENGDIKDGVANKTSYRVFKSHSMRHKPIGGRSLKLQRKQTASCAEAVHTIIDNLSNTKIEALLGKVSEWSFDVFALDYASNGKALLLVVLELFIYHDLFNIFDLDVFKLISFISLVEKKYQNNPYHNAIHAADVTQAMHCYIIQQKIGKHVRPIEVLIALLSAITHDIDHPGVNQSFLVATNDKLANLYKNTSVLEKHHWKTAMETLQSAQLLDHLSLQQRFKIESEMKSFILATDMTKQQDFLQCLTKRSMENSLDMRSSEDRHFMLQIMLKCADICNPCRQWSTCESWSERVCEEFFSQGDRERDLDLEISNLCDRFTQTIPNIQTGFIDYCVKPLITEVEKYLNPGNIISVQLTNLILNRQLWQQKIEAAKLVVGGRQVCNRLSNLRLTTNTDSHMVDEDVLGIEDEAPSPSYKHHLHHIQFDFGDCPPVKQQTDETLRTRRVSVPALNQYQQKISLMRRQISLDGCTVILQSDTDTDTRHS